MRNNGPHQSSMKSLFIHMNMSAAEHWETDGRLQETAILGIDIAQKM